jgi:three-Cys-motif partner protein
MAKRKTIDLDVVRNTACEKDCNSKKRDEITDNDLCTRVSSVIDNLRIRCVGEWSRKKIIILVKYFNMFSVSMKKSWNNLYYIEICSGPGRCIDRLLGNEFDGTSLCVARRAEFKNISKAIFFDHNPEIVDILNQRLTKLNLHNAHAHYGDYFKADDICDYIASETDQKGLYLIFIDPTDCSVPFELIRKLKERFKNIDFIINIAIGTDFTRNITNSIQNPKSYSKVISKYSTFLGTSDFFKDPKLKKSDTTDLRALFRDYYVNSLKSIGYKFTAFERIKNYYDLIFVSSHERGLYFWKEATKIEYDGQRQLVFE